MKSKGKRKEKILPPPTEWLRQLEMTVWGSKGPHRSHLSGKHGRYASRRFYLPQNLMSKVMVGDTFAYANNEGETTENASEDKGTTDTSQLSS